MARADALKMFWMKFDMGEWLTDPSLMLTSPGARGFWIDLICHMRLAHAAELTAPEVQFARLGRCSEAEASLYLEELRTQNVADVERGDGAVRIVCRRIARELNLSEVRASAREGKGVPTKDEQNSSQNDNKTPHKTTTKREQKGSQTSYSYSGFNSVPDKGVQGEPHAEVGDAIELVYQAYPRRVAKPAALRAIHGAVVRLGVGRDRPPLQPPEALAYLRERAQAFARSPAGQAGEFTPHPTTWFNQERYADDEREWQAGGSRNGGRDGESGGSGSKGVRRVDEALAELRKAGVEVPFGPAEGDAGEVQLAARGGHGRGAAGVVLEGSG